MEGELVFQDKYVDLEGANRWSKVDFTENYLTRGMPIVNRK